MLGVKIIFKLSEARIVVVVGVKFSCSSFLDYSNAEYNNLGYCSTNQFFETKPMFSSCVLIII